MEISDYIIRRRLPDGRVILFSTLTTSLVVLEDAEYDSIFVRNDYSQDCVDGLKEMGFLVDDKRTQQAMLYEARRTFIGEPCRISHVTLATTTECNANCYYCFEHGCIKKTANDETVDAVIDYIADNCKDGTIHISWFGGEPLLDREHMDRIVKQLRARGICVGRSSMTTNGSLLDRDMVSKLNEWNIGKLQITIDGIGEDYNSVKRYRGLSDPFTAVMANVENVASAGIDTYLRINYNPASPEASLTVMDYLRSRFGRYPNIHVYAASLDLPDRKYSPEFNVHLERMLTESVRDDEDMVGQHSNISSDRSFKGLLLRKLMIHPSPGMCYAQSYRKVVIDPEGLLYSCHRFVGKKQYSIGDVWTGYADNEINRYIHNPECADPKCVTCNLLPICQGGCFDNRFRYGTDSFCCAVRDIVEDLVEVYYNEMVLRTPKDPVMDRADEL